MNKRIEWIDTAKAVAIILVGIGHYSCPKLLMAFIYSFHMPLFFILSGITFNTSKYTFQQFLIRKLKTLVFPWWIAVVLYAVFQNTCLTLGMSGVHIPWINIIPRIFWHYRVGAYDPVYWFIPCLFVTELLLYWILKLCKNRTHIFVLMLVWLGAATAYYYGVGKVLVWEIDLIPLTAFYICIGILVKEWIINFIENSANLKLILIGISSMAIAFILSCWNLNITGNIFGISDIRYGNMGLAVVASFAGSLGVIVLCKYISCGLLKYIGRNSLMFYLLQPFTYKIADVMLCICLPFYRYAGNVLDLVLLHLLANILILLYVFCYNKVKEKTLHKITKRV